MESRTKTYSMEEMIQMPRQEVVKLRCDNPRCGARIELDSKKKTREVEDEWIELTFGVNKAKHETAPSPDETYILCPVCREEILSLVDKFFTEKRGELEWSYVVSTEVVKR